MRIMVQIAENLMVSANKLREFELKILSTMTDSKADSKEVDSIDYTEWYFLGMEQDSPCCLTQIVI